jgi:hypothetical protein
MRLLIILTPLIPLSLGELVKERGNLFLKGLTPLQATPKKQTFAKRWYLVVKWWRESGSRWFENY